VAGVALVFLRSGETPQSCFGSNRVAAAQVLRPQGAVRRSALYEATPGSGPI